MKYKLSYTAASLRIHDTLLVAEAMQKNNFENIDQQIGNGKTSTGMRVRKELVKRLNNLTEPQLNYLLDAGIDNAKKMTFVAVCKTYAYIYEFVVEVLGEKMINLDYHIREADYLMFFNRKAELHPELEKLAETSAYKIKQVLFRMLEETGFINSVRYRMLQPQYIPHSMETLIREDDPNLLRIFFIKDEVLNQ